MIATIPFVNTTTNRTEARCVAGINLKQGHAHELGFVGDKLLELVKRPVRLSCSLLAPNRDSLADAGQTFDGYRSTCVFRLLHDAFTDRMICVGLEVGLLARKFAELALGCLSILALKVTAAMGVDTPIAFHGITGVSLPVRIGCKLDDTQINTEDTIWLNQGWLLDVARGIQIPFATTQEQVRLALLGSQQNALMFTTLEVNMIPACRCPNGDERFIRVPAQDTIIIGDGRKGAKGALSFTIQFVGVSHASDTAHHDLRRKLRESLAGVVVGQCMEVVLTEYAGFPGALRQIVAGLVGKLHRMPESIGLFWGRLKFHLRSQFHGDILAHSLVFVKYRKGKPAFLPRLKTGVSNGRLSDETC